MAAHKLRDFGNYDAREIEKLVLSYWEEHEIPQKLSEHRKGAKKFFLLDGPPYINALPHVGHVKTTACKDVWTRFKYMQGFDCLIQAGFDCHGLPVEVMVEKELGIERKSQILEMGVEKFMQTCLSKILNNEKAWTSYYRTLGAWRAFFEPYFTYKPYYIESAWWTFKTLYEKGFVVQGARPIHWCPHCETALSGYEVSDSYKEMSDPSTYIKFKVKGTPNEYLVIWTTTPWTMPANVAIAASPRDKYVKAKSTNENGVEEVYIVAEKLVQQVFEMVGRKYEITGRMEGRELDGLEYEALIACEAQRELNYSERARRVYMSIPVMAKKKYKKHVKGKGAEVSEEFEEFVTTEHGTGLGSCGPGHGHTDNLFAKHYNLPVVSPVNERGEFTDEVEQWKGEFVKKADKHIVEYLKKENKLFHAAKITHAYPLCWRCKTPLIFRNSEQIFLSIEKIKPKMLRENNSTRWMPEFGQEAFANWVAQANDWCVSQQRFWGIPIPLWKCGGCGAKKVIGSVKELQENAFANEHNKKIDFNNLEDLHRGTLDAIELKCGECGSAMHRIPDIFNVWVDSGIAAWASLGYPHAEGSKQLFESVFPVDLVDESQDQIRGWFYALQFLAAAAFDKPAFRSVAMNGWVVDEKGEKMSKSLGNVVGAAEAIDKIGADALRLYYCWDISPWDTQKFSFTNALEARKALAIFFNSLKFHEMYSQAAGKEGNAVGLDELKLEVEDKWVLSRLNSVAGEAQQHFEQFEFHHAGKKLANFLVEEVSRWYIKLARDRVSPEAPKEKRETALAVLKHVLVESSKLLAPVAPFASEYVFQKLSLHHGGDSESVHFQRFPVSDKKWVDERLEENMKAAVAVTQAANSLRQESKLKLRWPLKRLLVVVGKKELRPALEGLQHLLKAQNNVLEAGYSEEPPAGGEWKEKKIVLEDGSEVGVFLDVQRDEEMERGALLRELLRAIQASRKQNGLVVQQKISLELHSGSQEIGKFLQQHVEEIKREVGAGEVSVVFHEGALKGEFSAQAEIEGVGKIVAKYSKK